MTYTWYLIFNTVTFDALGLVSKKYTLNLENIGQKDILVTKGITYGLTYEGVFLSLEMTDLNPFPFDGHAIYVDENDNVYLGIEVDEN